MSFAFHDSVDPHAVHASVVSCRKMSPLRRIASAFTLVELLVVIGIIALLISILLPSLNKARESAKTVQCLSNLRQMGLALELYKHNYKGHFPVARGAWNGASGPNPIFNLLPDMVQPQGPNAQAEGTIWHCPNQPEAFGGVPVAWVGYATNVAWDQTAYDAGWGLNDWFTPRTRSAADLRRSSETLYVVDCIRSDQVYVNPADLTMWYDDRLELKVAHPYGPDPRHNGQYNALLCDGHAQSYQWHLPTDLGRCK